MSEQYDIARDLAMHEDDRLSALPVGAADVLRWAHSLADHATEPAMVRAILAVMEARAQAVMADAASLADELIANLDPQSVPRAAEGVRVGRWTFGDTLSFLVCECEDGDVAPADVRREIERRLRPALLREVQQA